MQFEQTVSRLDTDIAELTNLLNETENQLRQAVQQQQETDRQAENLRRKLTDTNRLLDAKNNEYKLTKALVDKMEGYPEALKFVSRHQQWSKDIPLLSDIVSSPEAYRAGHRKCAGAVYEPLCYP